MQHYRSVQDIGANAAQDKAIVREALTFFTEGEFRAWKQTLASDNTLMARYGGLVAAHKYTPVNAPSIQHDLTQLHTFEKELGTEVEAAEKALINTAKDVNAAYQEEMDLWQKYPGQNARITREASKFWQAAEKTAQIVEKKLLTMQHLEIGITNEISRLTAEIGKHNILAATADPLMLQLKQVDTQMRTHVPLLMGLMQRLINHIQARWL